MKKLAAQIGVLMVVAIGLSACEKTMQTEVAIVEEEAVSTTDDTAIEAKPESPSLFFTWDISQANIISPPIEVRTSASEACRQRGFDTAGMINLAISGKMAEAEFGCRGAD